MDGDQSRPSPTRPPAPDRGGSAGTTRGDALVDARRRSPIHGRAGSGRATARRRIGPCRSTRGAAFEAALTAYARGDFFEAHEDLEPAWMGTDDLEERALHQGLIKVAAAYVHAVRGNPAGSEEPRGRPTPLALAGAAGAAWGVDVPGPARRHRRPP